MSDSSSDGLSGSSSENERVSEGDNNIDDNSGNNSGNNSEEIDGLDMSERTSNQWYAPIVLVLSLLLPLVASGFFFVYGLNSDSAFRFVLFAFSGFIVLYVCYSIYDLIKTRRYKGEIVRVEFYTLDSVTVMLLDDDVGKAYLIGDNGFRSEDLVEKGDVVTVGREDVMSAVSVDLIVEVDGEREVVKSFEDCFDEHSIRRFMDEDVDLVEDGDLVKDSDSS